MTSVCKVTFIFHRAVAMLWAHPPALAIPMPPACSSPSSSNCWSLRARCACFMKIAASIQLSSIALTFPPLSASMLSTASTMLGVVRSTPPPRHRNKPSSWSMNSFTRATVCSGGLPRETWNAPQSWYKKHCPLWTRRYRPPSISQGR